MRRLIPPIVALALAAPAAAAAGGNTPAALIQDCLRNGKITGHYSQQVYARALASLPTDVAEYSDCADVIRRAELAAAAGQPAPGAGSHTNPRANPLTSATAASRAAVAAAQRTGRAPVKVGAQVIQPGVVPVRASSITGTLPTALLVALASLLSIALALGGRRALAYVRARRSR
jgi:hypothetical protein